MTPEEINLVQRSFEWVVPIADAAAALFYARLFDLNPSLRALFHSDLHEQGHKLMQMIGVAVRGLDQLHEIVPTVQQLGQRHAAYGVQNNDYATVGAALLWTLEQGLGEQFTPEVRAAWTKTYTLLADTMRAAAPAAVPRPR